MYQIVYTSQMKKGVRLMKKRGKDLEKLEKVLFQLASGCQLPPQNRDHQLTGEMRDFRECHIEPDWLLIYRFYDDLLILSATATGSHSDLLGK